MMIKKRKTEKRECVCVMARKLTEEQKEQLKENGKLGGRPPKYDDLDAFKAKVDAFIDYCDSNDVDATDYQIINYFGISPRTLDRYRADYNTDADDKESKSTYKGYGEALKKIDLYREDAAIRQAKDDPKLSGHVAFKLKQPHWGGWTDKQQVDTNNKTQVTVTLKTID